MKQTDESHKDNFFLQILKGATEYVSVTAKIGQAFFLTLHSIILCVPRGDAFLFLFISQFNMLRRMTFEQIVECRSACSWVFSFSFLLTLLLEYITSQCILSGGEIFERKSRQFSNQLLFW